MTKSTKIFFALLGVFSILQLFKIFSPSIFLRQSHLQSKSFPEWAFIQTIPSMYNYSNRVWESSYEYDPVTVKELLAGELEHEGMQINHFPLRVFTFRQDREQIFKSSLKTLYVRSKFMGSFIVTAYEVSIKNGVAEVTLKEVRVRD